MSHKTRAVFSVNNSIGFEIGRTGMVVQHGSFICREMQWSKGSWPLWTKHGDRAPGGIGRLLQTFIPSRRSIEVQAHDGGRGHGHDLAQALCVHYGPDGQAEVVGSDS